MYRVSFTYQGNTRGGQPSEVHARFDHHPWFTETASTEGEVTRIRYVRLSSVLWPLPEAFTQRSPRAAGCVTFAA
ncbi:MAG: hypothetical protein IPJ61_16675 [Tessaracoccus sp.]|uniref:hypothetical protein n=1 Tax=Tessaracoccus sp. TaxID=1971211 RepID=UPI001ED5B705|nr:hypothetical protein [Tessaracoccus sp.]MBK7822646.1 hypothetical protein [Tessaracoccus sp.]